MTPDIESAKPSLRRAIRAMGSTAKPPKAKKRRKPASYAPLAKVAQLGPVHPES